MADASTWGVFFTGKYKVIADGIDEGVMHLKFGASNEDTLIGQGHRGGELFSFALKLHSGVVPGRSGEIGGGHVFTKYTSQRQTREFVLVIFEMSKRGKDWVVGIDPTGKATRIQFQAIQGGSLVFESTTIKARPDVNYPWNI